MNSLVGFRRATQTISEVREIATQTCLQNHFGRHELDFRGPPLIPFQIWRFFGGGAIDFFWGGGTENILMHGGVIFIGQNAELRLILAPVTCITFLRVLVP